MANLNPNATIAAAKLNQYLLVPLSKDDKSKFLAQAGYGLANWQELEQDLRNQILPLEATPSALTPYGQKYVIVGNLIGPNGVRLAVKTIWLVNDQGTRFVTLFPA